MKRTVYISSLVCSLLFSACDVETLQPQAGDTCPLQLGFVQEGNASLVGRNGSGRASTLTAEDGNIDKIGVCITGIGHEPYPGTTDTRYTFTPDGKGYAGTDIPSDATSPVTIYLNGKDATIQAFHPATATVSNGSGSNYTIPATISQNQKFNGTAITDATDYLYGSSKNTTGDAATITANALSAANASPTIHMHHALAKVVFTLQCDANRTPNATYDRVKSIKMTATNGTPFRHGTGTMQINNGTLAGGLTGTNELTFTPADGADPIVIGTNGTAATVACGLVAPLSATPGNITLTITLGAMGSADKDRTYTATNAAFNVQWQKGYCYTYNLVLGNKLTTTSQAITWNAIAASPIDAKERGISTASELKSFRETWNEKGLQKKGTTDEYDYTPYEPYGWYDKNDGGRFTIKLTSDITFSESESWTPIGTEDKPLAIPFDGQGWKVVLQLQSAAMTITGKKYSGFIGYAITDIKNLSIVTDPQSTIISTVNNKITSTEATYAGGLAGYVEGNLTSCSVDLKGTAITNSAPTATACYVGGLVGYCKGNIYNSAVYVTSAEGNAASITITNATDGSCLGGLAGKVEGTSGSGGNVTNCYTHLEGLGYSSPGSPKVSAGWMVGGKDGTTFADNHYLAGTSDVSPDDSKDGISSFTDWRILCANLNQTATANKWAQWKEESNAASSKTEKVTLILR